MHPFENAVFQILLVVDGAGPQRLCSWLLGVVDVRQLSLPENVDIVVDCCNGVVRYKSVSVDSLRLRKMKLGHPLSSWPFSSGGLLGPSVPLVRDRIGSV